MLPNPKGTYDLCQECFRKLLSTIFFLYYKSKYNKSHFSEGLRKPIPGYF